MAGGFFSRLFGGGSKPRATSRDIPSYVSPSSSASTHEPQAALSHAGGEEIRVGKTYDDMEVAGESHYRANVGALFASFGLHEGGVTMRVAQLQPEPNNRHDRYAVRVVVDGLHVGYVPSDESERVFRMCRRVGQGNVAVVPVRIWASNQSGDWRARVTLAFSGSTEREKDYAAERRDMEMREARAEEALQAKRAKEEHKEARRLAGSVDGQHWKMLKPAVIELKRQSRLDEALVLAVRTAEAATREARVAGTRPDSWPTEQASMILRKQGEVDREIEVLRTYIAECGEHDVPGSVRARLDQATR